MIMVYVDARLLITIGPLGPVEEIVDVQSLSVILYDPTAVP